ncbi:uncharacterized protein [Misgurnus anguillicaudatus]|uniref:uncharacterized protein n=1 Tax=Misgurnus anguillicaudatus TaxID=75329 RepID=UPI003CCF7A46
MKKRQLKASLLLITVTMASMGLIFLCLLHLPVQMDVSTTVLAKMIQYFDDNVQPKPGAQYAIAIRLSKEQCTDETFSIETVFSRADVEKVNKTLTDGQTCELCTDSKNVIAANPQYKNPKNHSEYRLLYPVGKSPMDNLLKNVDKNSCVVFYTYNSPCVKECISGEKNILEGLSNWKNKQQGGVNFFVFQNIWKKDKSKKNLSKEFQKIEEKVPLYRCFGEQINCLKYGDNNNNQILSD